MDSNHPKSSSQEEQLRAGTYTLLAGLLQSPPDAALLARMHTIDSSSDPAGDGIAGAWAALKQAAEAANPAVVAEEFQDLFIGIGRGELVPYGSWYLTGFLMEKPLGELRRSLADLGYERQENTREPEDHAAALCEVMALLIHDSEVSFEQQRGFFESHVGNWIESFFRDLEKSRAGDFYRPVGRLGRTFIALEKQYFSMLV